MNSAATVVVFIMFWLFWHISFVARKWPDFRRSVLYLGMLLSFSLVYILLDW